MNRWDVSRIQASGCKSGASSRRNMLHRLAVDRSGSPALEFALVATPLAALIVAIMQTSLVFFAQQNLETAAEKSVRQVLTGSAQQSGMTADGFRTLVCSKLPDFMQTNSCANLIIDVRSANGFSSADTSTPAITYDPKTGKPVSTFTPGGADSINVVRVMYVWNVIKGPLGFDLSTMSNQQRLLVATSVFKTEHYQ